MRVLFHTLILEIADNSGRHASKIVRDYGGFMLISSAEGRLDSSWQSSGAVVRCFADVASPAPSFAQPLDSHRESVRIRLGLRAGFLGYTESLAV